MSVILLFQIIILKKGNKMAKDVTDELLKVSSLEDNKENRDC